jgi:hypothetical protein
MSAVVTHRTTDLRHRNRVRQIQEEKEIRDLAPSKVGVPDRQAFALEGRHMSQTREQERVEVFRGFRTRNNTSRKDVPDLVALVGPQIGKDPDVDPTVRFLAFEELCSVD